MPLIGWLFGMNFELYIRSIDHWIAVFLLSFLGIKMIVEAIKDDDNASIERANPVNNILKIPI
jgi:manganese efflux pump family protein